MLQLNLFLFCSHSPAVPVLVPDAGVHQAQATTSGLGNLGNSTMFMEAVTSTERQPVSKVCIML
jgi:hypothetical protein